MVTSLYFTSVLLLSIAGGYLARPLPDLPSQKPVKEKPPLENFRPYNIAHRGSSGELPEETAAAYTRAIEEGADFIETDVMATKDGALICFHDTILDHTTDIADRKEFADRKRTYEVQWQKVTGWFTVDFTLEEIKSLRVKQRFGYRDQHYNGKFQIITFDEFIAIALNASRVVGIYPELKNPVFINNHVKWAGGKKYEDKFIETVKKYGYNGKFMSKEWIKKPIYIQSFALTSLVYVSKLINSPKVFLIGGVASLTEDTKQTYEEITSDSNLDYMRKYVIGIAPWKESVVAADDNGYLTTPTDLIARAHDRGLQVHPYTFKNDDKLHFDFHQDPYEEFNYWISAMTADALFTDFPESLHHFQEWTAPRPVNLKAFGRN